MKATRLVPIKRTLFVCYLLHIFVLFVEEKMVTTFEGLKDFVHMCIKFAEKELRTATVLVRAWENFASDKAWENLPADEAELTIEFVPQVSKVVYDLQLAVNNAILAAGAALIVAEVRQAAMEAGVIISSSDEDSQHSATSQITDKESDTVKDKSEGSGGSKSDVAISSISEDESKISKSAVLGEKPEDSQSVEDRETENNGHPSLETMLKKPVKGKSVTAPTWESYVKSHETQSREREKKTETKVEPKAETKVEGKNYWKTRIETLIRAELVKPTQPPPDCSRTSARRSITITPERKGKSPASTLYQYVKKSTETSSVEVGPSAQGITPSAQIGPIKPTEETTGKKQSSETELKSSDDGSAAKGKQTDEASSNVQTTTQKRAISESAAKDSIGDLTSEKKDSEEEGPLSPLKKGRLSEIPFQPAESVAADPTEKSDSVAIESPEKGSSTTTESSPEKSMED